MNYDDMSREQLIEIAKKAKDHEIKANPAYLAAIATAENRQAGIIEALRKENKELREQLEAIGAGGVSGKLMPGAVSAEAHHWHMQIQVAIERAKIFDDGADGADAESARSVVGILSGLLAAPIAAQAQQEKIKALESEVSGLRAARIAYANEFQPDAEGNPDVGNIHANIRKLKAQAQPKKTALERYKESGCAEEEPSPLERLRFFCSLAMSGDDWVDAGPLFDSVSATQQPVSGADGLPTDLELDGWAEDLSRLGYESNREGVEAYLRKLFSDRAALAQQDSMLDSRIAADMAAIVETLDEGEWAEHIAKADLGQRLERHITQLVGKQQDASKVDAALAEMVHAMFRSANSIPVTRITIDRKQYEAAIDAARKEPDQ